MNRLEKFTMLASIIPCTRNFADNVNIFKTFTLDRYRQFEKVFGERAAI